MIRYISLLLFIGLAWGQNPCEDERYLELMTKSLDAMSDREYQYFLNYDVKCSEYQKSQTIIKPNESNLLSNGERLKALNPQIKNQNCYQDGIEAAQIDFSNKGYLPGAGCGLFGLIGWGFGTLVYAMKEPNTPYMYLNNLDGDCKYEFNRGYKQRGKKIRNKNFHTVAGGLTAVFLLINLSVSQ